MATRGTKRSSGTPAAAAPLQGAMREEGDNEQLTIMKMVMDKLDAIERQNRLQAAAVEALTTAQAEGLTQLEQRWQVRMAQDKAEAAEVMRANFEKFHKIIEAKQADPKTRNEIIRLEMQRAKKEAEEHATKFKVMLETMPTGDLFNSKNEPVTFIINGVPKQLQPGWNHDVPQIFIEEWDKQKEIAAWANGVKKALTPPEDGRLDANVLNARLGLPPLWSKDTGKL